MERTGKERRSLGAIGTVRPVALAIICFWISLSPMVRAQYKPADGPLMTRWAQSVSPADVHEEYPRPQMVRRQWRNLNGLWDWAIRPKDAVEPETFDGKILVPFAAESALSGVMKRVGPDNRLWYKRTFTVPATWNRIRGENASFGVLPQKRIILHFGAVDWETSVWINGRLVGTHKGGYDPFSFDITKALQSGEQEIVVSVWDPTNAGPQPRGKQVRKPGGIWYTPVTGIWQTVWIEPVDEAYIKALTIVPDIDGHKVLVTAECSDAAAGCTVEARVNGDSYATARGRGSVGEQLALSVLRPKLWSPDSPYLYDLKVTLKDRWGRCLDEVSSYFGMRKIALDRDEDGIVRLFLNNEPLFQYGPLDQGWWPDGLYTAPSDEALKYDIEITKRLGCNMLRKHVKVEPDRFYYWCDKLGVLVWQDMPNGNNQGEDAREQFERELVRMIEAFRNHPSIVMWVPFNEGWGQYDTPRIVELVKQHDSSRLVNNASGWTDRGVGDVHDIHSYPGPAVPPLEENRAAVLGEFGGLGLPLSGHTWQSEKNWGYRSYKDRGELTDAYVALVDRLHMLVGEGLAAAVYTQTTDVEIEVNGWMTYDRAVIKMDGAAVTMANKKLYLPPPIIKPLVPTSRKEAQVWRYTMTEPAAGWQEPGFDDSAWKQGPGGFGTEDTPGTVVRTQWDSSDIWIRRTFDLEAEPNEPLLYIHHDEDAQVYVNGVLAGKFADYTTSYQRVALSEAAAAALKVGENQLAVHCKQTTGGQYIDVGLVEIIEPAEEK